MKKVTAYALLLCLLFMCFSACNSTSEPTDASDSSESHSIDETEKESGGNEMISFEYTNDTLSIENGIITAPKKKGSTAVKPLYTAAFSSNELTKSSFAAEVTLKLSNVASGAGMIFGAAATSDGGCEGFTFMASRTDVILQKIKLSKDGNATLTELGKRSIEPIDLKTYVKLRIEYTSGKLRAYYLDDFSNAIVPWPEIEAQFSVLQDKIGVGIIDNGNGASFSNITVYGSDAIYNQGNSGVGTQYINPVFDGGNYADPQVIAWEGKYYCYSTSASGGFNVLESSDMVNWVDKGRCLTGAWNTAEGRFWAPEVVEMGGKFYMVFSNADILGIAVADSPLGPFKHNDSPLIYNAIDGHIFFDDDGKVYLYYVSWGTTDGYGIYGCELEPDLSRIKADTRKMLIKPDKPWEQQGESITEGPSMLKHNGVYYLTYSGSHYTNKNYAVGYAVSTSPLGKYEKYDGGPFLSYTKQVNGPGHHSFITVGNEMFIVYHAHNKTTAFEGRNICIDRVRFAPTASGVDRIEMYGPTRSPQNAPKAN